MLDQSYNNQVNHIPGQLARGKTQISYIFYLKILSSYIFIKRTRMAEKKELSENEKLEKLSQLINGSEGEGEQNEFKELLNTLPVDLVNSQCRDLGNASNKISYN